MKPSTLNPTAFDRTDFVPFHEGDHVLPHDLLFHRLYFLAVNQNSVAVKDADKGYERNYHQLLSDVISARNLIRKSLSPGSLQHLRAGDEVCLLIVARGYEFVVTFLAVLCLGAIATPQSELFSEDFEGFV